MKGHVVGFGHKVKWDHDLIDLCWVYVRVRSLETYSSTLVVVDTIDIAFRNNLVSLCITDCFCDFFFLPVPCMVSFALLLT